MLLFLLRRSLGRSRNRGIVMRDWCHGSGITVNWARLAPMHVIPHPLEALWSDSGIA
jgi:hypothetical protein